MDSFTKELTEVNIAIESCKNRRMLERYQAVKLYLEGHDAAHIASISGRCLKTIYNYLNAYQTGGLEALDMKHPSGRPAMLTAEEKQIVVDVLTNNAPGDIGFQTEVNWTSSIVREWINFTFNVRYSPSGIRFLLHELGFTCARPSYYKCTGTEHILPIGPPQTKPLVTIINNIEPTVDR
jgi:transposase